MKQATIKDQLRVSFRKDGEDHVNLNHFGETQIGVFCSPDWRKRFHVPHLGDFASARCFANFLLSNGDEIARHDNRYILRDKVPQTHLRGLMIYAKFYQLLAVWKSVKMQKDDLNLPWVMYKKYLSGIKEYDRWEEYPAQVKEFVKFIVENGGSTKFDWEQYFPGLLGLVNNYVAKVAIFNGEEEGSIQTLEELDLQEELNRQARKNKFAGVTTEEKSDEHHEQNSENTDDGDFETESSGYFNQVPESESSQVQESVKDDTTESTTEQQVVN